MSKVESKLCACLCSLVTYADDFQIRLPDAGTLAGLNLARDWSEELKRAEAER